MTENIDLEKKRRNFIVQKDFLWWLLASPFLIGFNLVPWWKRSKDKTLTETKDLAICSESIKRAEVRFADNSNIKECWKSCFLTRVEYSLEHWNSANQRCEQIRSKDDVSKKNVVIIINFFFSKSCWWIAREWENDSLSVYSRSAIYVVYSEYDVIFSKINSEWRRRNRTWMKHEFAIRRKCKWITQLTSIQTFIHLNWLWNIEFQSFEINSSNHSI
jgi:hypothetical protein